MKKYLIIIFAFLALPGYSQQDLKARYMNVTRMLYSGTDSLISPSDSSHQFNYMKMKDPVLSLDGVNKRSMERFIGDTAKLLHWSDTLPTSGARIATGDDIKSMIDGSGTANLIPKFSDANTLTNSAIKDDGASVTINQNGVAVATSVTSGAIGNTLCLRNGYVGINNIYPLSLFNIQGLSTDRIIIGNSTAGSVNTDSPKLSFWGNSATSSIITGFSIQKINTSGGNGSGRFALFQHKSGDYTNETEVFSILSTGLAGFNTILPTKQVEINSETGANLRLIYNDADGSPANYVDYGVTSSGDATVTPSGGDVVISGRITTTQITAALTDNTPTDAEIDAATSLTPSTAGAGWQCTIKDNNGSGLLYKIESDGTDWYYIALTKAL